MKSEGSGASGLYTVAEALGATEAADGLPLRPNAPAGGVFDRTLRRAGISRESLAISNVLHCQPGKANLLEHQWFEHGAINHCRVHMDREVAQFRPKAMLALGGIPLRTLTGYCGPKQSITNVRGFILDNLRYPGIPVVSTYHPSYIARDKSNLLGVFRMDILRALALAKNGGQFTRPVKHYVKFPDIAEAETWLIFAEQHPELPICYDIETEDSITGEDESVLRVNADGAVEINPLKPEFVDAYEEEKEKEEAIAAEYKVSSNNTRITQIQFSITGTMDAIVLPWVWPFMELAKRVMALPNPKLGWNNWGFDDPVLEMAGAKIGGVNHDAMWMWHHLQPDLPRGLQYGMSFYFPEAKPWKHLAQDDVGEYGGDDVAYLRIAGPKLIEALKERGIWAGYERHVLRLHPILVGASRRGIPVDDERRRELGERVTDLRRGVDAELQGMFPDELRGVQPASGYINPKLAEKRRALPNEGLEEGERWEEREFPAKVEPGGSDAVGEGPESGIPADGAVDNSRTGKVRRWCRIQPFLPNSSQQILRYIRWRRAEEVEAKIASYRKNARFQSYSDRALREMGERNAVYKVPKKFGEDKDTTEKKELERLGAKTGDRFFSLTVEHREYGKVMSTYHGGWCPGPDRRVHPTFGFGPATGQKNSHRPNAQNMPKPGGIETPAEQRKTDLAHACRRMVCAPPGYKLIEVDKKGFHALTLGFEAQCPEYMRIASLDVHSFVTANFMWSSDKNLILKDAQLPPNPERWMEMPDEELNRVLKVVKKKWKAIRDKKIKCSVHAVGFGAGSRKIFDMNKRDPINPQGLESEAEVKKINAILKALFGKVFQFQANIKALGHRQSFLKSRHGYMRWFFDIFHNQYKMGRWEQVAGKDAEAAIAFLPANDAFGMIDCEKIRLDDMGAMERYGFIDDLHDALLFCCPDKLVEEALHVITGEMRKPSEVLIDPLVVPNGLVCDVEASVGQDWDSMEEVKVVKEVVHV